MDGVLFMSSQAHAEAYAEVCRSLDLVAPDYRELAGMRTDQAFQKLATAQGRTLSPAELQAAVDQKRVRARTSLRTNPPVDPQAAATIRQLKGTGCRLALASSSSRENVELFLTSSGLSKAFEVVLSGDDLTQGKPDPEIYLKACAGLGVSPTQCWAIEDSAQGIEAAVRAGLKVIGRTGELSDPELLRAGASTTIHSLSEIPTLHERGLL